MNKKTVLVLLGCLAGVMIGTLFYMVYNEERIYVGGREFKFRTAPVDPFDAFMGRYVALNLEETSAVKDPRAGEFLKGQSVYARVDVGPDGFAYFSGVSDSAPESGAYIKCRVEYDSGDLVHLRVPIDRYYMEENKAPDAERMFNELQDQSPQKAYVLVNIKNGAARVKELYIGDKSVKETLRSGVNAAVPQEQLYSDENASFEDLDSEPEKPETGADTFDREGDYVPIEDLLPPDGWDVAVKFDVADYNDFYVFSAKPGVLGEVYAVNLDSQDDIYQEWVGRECCPEGSGYSALYESSDARRGKAWYVERKRVSDNEYRILIRGFSKIDCPLGGRPYVRGELLMNPVSGWRVTRIPRMSYHPSKYGQETFVKQAGNKLSFASGQACGGCCACVDGAWLDIELIVQK